jgi:hypothetical protein
MAPAENITNERLHRWKEHLYASHATPLLLVGVGHDHNRGALVICTLDESELDNEALAAFLREAIRRLEGMR